MTTPDEELTRLRQQLDRCDPEALIDLLIANRARTVRRLRRAVAKLRASTEATAAGHERLAALLGLTTDRTA
ncbi:hypothetical protein [Streptomyces canus]|uniref:hypothetical protein n=1 Tax=Streptomyces canus TaxID=58343 RepID=UPI00036F9840|nr:hypothetical protein [Streptomyces canus]